MIVCAVTVEDQTLIYGGFFYFMKPAGTGEDVNGEAETAWLCMWYRRLSAALAPTPPLCLVGALEIACVTPTRAVTTR